MAEATRPSLGAWTQTALLGLLCYSNTHGLEVSASLGTDHFDGVHKDLAEAVMHYRRKYKGKAPGKEHLPMLLERMPVQEEKLKAIKLLAASLPKAMKRLNRDHVVSLGIEFAKKQNYKNGLLRAAELISKPEVDLGEVEKLLHDIARLQPQVAVQGIRFSDPDQSMKWIKKREQGYKLGIKPLDQNDIDLKLKTMLLYEAAKNTGKSWFGIHVGRQCILQGANVLHVTLEMSQDQVAMRYFQNWLGIGLNEARYLRPKLDKDKSGRVSGWHIKHFTPRMHLKDPDLERKLIEATAKWALKWDRLEIQEFPTGQLTLEQLQNRLDYLDSHHDFQPHVIIIDYPDLMKVSNREFLRSLSDVYVGLRGVGVERNAAMVCPTQVNRQGMAANKVRSTHTSQAIDKVFTADTVLTYSQTQTERNYQLARLAVEHARDGSVGLEVCIAQGYPIGQYVLDALPMGDGYKEKMGETGEGDTSPPPDKHDGTFIEE